MNKFVDKLNAFNLFLIFVSYPLVSVFTSLAGLDTYAVLYPYRLFFLLFQVFLLFFNFQRRKAIFTTPVKLITFFFILYTVKVFVDLYIENVYVPSKYGAIFYLGYTLTSFLQVINLQFVTYKEIKKLDKYIYILMLLYGVLSLKISLMAVELFGRGLSGKGIGTIEYGHMGAFIFILALSKIYSPKRKVYNWSGKLLDLFGVFLGVIIIGVAASKGPLVSLVVVLLFFILSKVDFNKVLFLTLVSILFYLSWGYFISFLYSVNSSIIGRILHLYYSGDNNRMTLWHDAWLQFINNPVFGGGFVLEKGFGRGFYPHNLLLESFMAMGLIGGPIFIWINYKAIASSVFLLKNNKLLLWVPLGFIQFFMGGMFSGSIYAAFYYWAFMALVFRYKNLITVKNPQ